jgi:glutamyl-tRNA synthetase
LLNFLAMQGWNPSADREKYAMTELIDLFDLHAVNVSGSIVNFEKLDWLNGQYIKELATEDLKRRLQPYTKLEMTDRLFTAACDMLKDRLVVLSDFDDAARFLVELPEYDVAKVVWKKSTVEQTGEVLKDLSALLSVHEDFSLGGLEALIEAYKEKTGKGNGDVLWPLRYSLSGLDQSPPPLMIAMVLQKDEVLRRLDIALDKFTARS